MSDVVLRCPNCGTTQGEPGECEACHEADVRYFCPNHTPGRWLDGPVCAECAARAERERAASRRPPPRRPSPPPMREVAPSPTEARRPPSPAPPRLPEDDWRDRMARTAERPPVVIGDVRGRGDPRTEVFPPRAPLRAPPLLGCAFRLMVIAVAVIVALTALSFVGLVVFGGSVGAWVEDVGQQFGVVGGVPEQTQRGIRAYLAEDFVTAERELREAARSYPRSGMALVYLARIPRVAADPERAREYLLEAVAREPDNVLAQRALADFYLSRYLVQASRQQASAGVGDSALGDLRNAQAYYRRALELDPTDQSTRDNYACVLAALGQSVDAERMAAEAGRRSWERCVRPAP